MLIAALAFLLLVVFALIVFTDGCDDDWNHP